GVIAPPVARTVIVPLHSPIKDIDRFQLVARFALQAPTVHGEPRSHEGMNHLFPENAETSEDRIDPEANDAPGRAFAPTCCIRKFVTALCGRTDPVVRDVVLVGVDTDHVLDIERDPSLFVGFQLGYANYQIRIQNAAGDPVAMPLAFRSAGAVKGNGRPPV